MKVGDPHNFGRRVEFVRNSEVDAYRKPRTVFWERLFFGLDSPLSHLIRPVAWPNSHQYDPGNFFRLSCIEDHGHAGTIAAVASGALLGHLNAFVNFGWLLGYAYCLGIQDLHCDNVISSNNGLQPIDVEVVLSDLSLPDQTHLLSRRGVDINDSALAHICDRPNAIPPEHFFELLAGFIAALQTIVIYESAVGSAIEQGIARAEVKPKIRALLHPTETYRQHVVNGSPNVSFIDEEITQMARGDIPYFYRYLDRDSLMYFADVDQERAVSATSLSKSSAIVNVLPPSRLLTQDRIYTQLMPRGLLYLLRHHLDPEWRGEHSLSDVRLLVGDQRWQVTIRGVAYRFAL